MAIKIAKFIGGSYDGRERYFQPWVQFVYLQKKLTDDELHFYMNDVNYGYTRIPEEVYQLDKADGNYHYQYTIEYLASM